MINMKREDFPARQEFQGGAAFDWEGPEYTHSKQKLMKLEK